MRLPTKSLGMISGLQKFRSLPSVFIGYSSQQKGYKCLHIPSGRVYVSWHVVFNEDIFPFGSVITPTDQPSSSSFVSCSMTLGVLPQSLSCPVSVNFVGPSNTSLRSSSLLLSTNHRPPIDIFSTSTNPPLNPIDPCPHDVPVTPVLPAQSPIVISLPTNTSPAPIIAKGIPHWEKAMQAEHLALIKNDTWTLVSPSPEQHVTNCKWVFRVKKNPDGSFQKCKAQLVATGVTQQYDIDYFDTFRPVVKATTIRVVLQLAVSKNWSTRQIDVNNAFLHGLLTEQVFMKQPPGFKDDVHPQYVCKLNKAIYGLKQAPRAWFHNLSSRLALGFTSSSADSSLFIRIHNKYFIFILVYVDDILITGDSDSDIQQVIAQLHAEFALKDLGNIHHFLGVQVTSTAAGLHLSQSTYVSEVLQRVNMDGAKPINNPSQLSNSSSTLADPFPDVTKFRSIVGALQYKPSLVLT
ncbi:transmembrane signal receptor [Lithospermum erythrorhizon]|uniref:Transmembrane signal receptor n=1 Tax=Lithospermum erythrorhizon TaxID=34254 RepID=A0AAV3RQX2_LITER